MSNLSKVAVAEDRSGQLLYEVQNMAYLCLSSRQHHFHCGEGKSDSVVWCNEPKLIFIFCSVCHASKLPTNAGISSKTPRKGSVLFGQEKHKLQKTVKAQMLTFFPQEMKTMLCVQQSL